MSKAGILRAETETAESTGQKTSHDGQTRTCPECNGGIITEESEHICKECGLVVQESTIDRGPEWRASTATERDKRARCGSPVTETLHDGGLTTEIDWQDKDANGNRLSEHQRRRANKIRRTQQYGKTAQRREESHRDGLGEINRMCSALGVKGHVKECACRLYQQCVEAGLLPGWSREDVSTAALNIALEQCNQSRDIEEILTVSQAPKEKVLRSQKQIADEFSLWDSIVPDEDELREKIAQHIRRLVSDCGASPVVEQATIDLLDAVEYARLGDGRKSMSYAAALLFETGRQLDAPNTPTQQEIDDAGGPCKKTIRTTGKKVIDDIDEETLNTIVKRD
ncbi:transcription initiation factor IIB [Haloarcula montana]|uniref:transcription initiation factor IIB n=1 Tax=Haloarcula montana TaxID=3111776 RepID=UPI002D77C8A2|nr:TFIIB-type zinc ribbon-containing protein [Haloarcula sp. GH36]